MDYLREYVSWVLSGIRHRNDDWTRWCEFDDFIVIHMLLDWMDWRDWKDWKDRTDRTDWIDWMDWTDWIDSMDWIPWFCSLVLFFDSVHWFHSTLDTDSKTQHKVQKRYTEPMSICVVYFQHIYFDGVRKGSGANKLDILEWGEIIICCIYFKFSSDNRILIWISTFMNPSKLR